jgi:hypoxanthine-guanine phosphoribosyltransferase
MSTKEYILKEDKINYKKVCDEKYLSLSGKSYYIFNDLVISTDQINYIASEIAYILGSTYSNQSLLFLHIKEGSLKFGNKVIEYYQKKYLNFDVGTVKINSYYGFESVEPKLIEPLVCKKQLIEYDKIIILDDLLDTGSTINFLLEKYFTNIKTDKVDICFLLEKNKKRSEIILKNINQYKIFVGALIKDTWVVGTGLDIRLPLDDKNHIYHLFRKDIKGGIYVFNKNFEKILFEDYSSNSNYVKNKLYRYVTEK